MDSGIFKETKSIAYKKVKGQLVKDPKSGYTEPALFRTCIYPPETIISNSGRVELFPSGWLKIHLSYAWDFASGPTINTKSTIRGSLAHDAIADLIKEGRIEACGLDVNKTWELSNDLIARLMEEDGAFKLRCIIWHWILDKFGFKTASKPDKIYYAP